jgi:hypothetical protein
LKKSPSPTHTSAAISRYLTPATQQSSDALREKKKSGARDLSQRKP